MMKISIYLQYNTTRLRINKKEKGGFKLKITVGGSFHEPGWTAVCSTVKKLQYAGHQVLAPRC